MSLHGFIGKLQYSCAGIYLDLTKSFAENGLFRETLASLAQDKEEQAKCLQALPSKYWNRHKEEKELFAAVKECISLLQKRENETDRSMDRILSKAFDFEEPIVLRIYAPLIRNLRTEWTDHTLDFYILTKAHVVRLSRIAQSFSGNPVIIQRSLTLLENFEKAVQAPDASLFPEKRQAGPKRTAKISKVAKIALANKKSAPRLKKTGVKHSLKTPCLTDRAKVIQKHAKPPLKKISLARRRARP
jgi:hypothetical protein